MANSERRYTDKEGRSFIPMNVEGSRVNEDFFSTGKIIAIAAIVLWLAYDIVTLINRGANLLGWFIYLLMWFIVSSLVLRYYVFEEKYYYKMYLELKKEKITTPSAFWSVANLNDTDDGCLITYIDGKIGYLIRVERDTITGKPPEFMEQHYDGISDFYKELNKKGYRYVQANIMEPAGKDERISELDQLVYKDSNPNIQKLMQYQVGHIKNVARKALYETDYFLIYTTDLNRIEVISSDIADCVYHLLDGAFISYSVLDYEEVNEMVKEQNGVKYFDPTEATLKMFSREGSRLQRPFKVKGIEFTDGKYQEIVNNRINKITCSNIGNSKNSRNIRICYQRENVICSC